MLAQISSGHIDLADFLFLLAFILIVVAGIIFLLAVIPPKLSKLERLLLLAAGACFALAWFVV